MSLLLSTLARERLARFRKQNAGRLRPGTVIRFPKQNYSIVKSDTFSTIIAVGNIMEREAVADIEYDNGFKIIVLRSF